MRKREIIRGRKRDAKLKIQLDRDVLLRYVESCQCPFCKDGITYKMLPLHIYQMHGISAYQLREDFGLNRRHKLISHETSELMTERSRRLYKELRFGGHSNWGNIESRYKDGGQREEAIIKKKEIANKPEAKQRFTNVMAKLDRKAIALRVPPGIRKIISSKAAKKFWQRLNDTQVKEHMAIVRSLRTPESERITDVWT